MAVFLTPFQILPHMRKIMQTKKTFAIKLYLIYISACYDSKCCKSWTWTILHFTWHLHILPPMIKSSQKLSQLSMKRNVTLLRFLLSYSNFLKSKQKFHFGMIENLSKTFFFKILYLTKSLILRFMLIFHLAVFDIYEELYSRKIIKITKPHYFLCNSPCVYATSIVSTSDEFSDFSS